MQILEQEIERQICVVRLFDYFFTTALRNVDPYTHIVLILELMQQICMYVCVRACAYVCARVRSCVRAYVRA